MGFIDGTSMKLNKEDDQYDKWVRAGSMVQSWILNVISKEMVRAFMYTKMARELLVRLEERFKESNGRLVYQIQREIASISEGSQYVVVYFTKLKMLWEELASVTPIQGCTCGA
ncbi:hypothetical protein Salat_2610600 [Sesamum alatum]|uniref:Retrotransposon gag domain-containing protein n=1 Tax=Sesamum alatum TaxID=300844 RepID=A0AAE1XNC1_9LAMI|nr:hypothetical protein Salat_2610600 [Sesamum alatum]